MSTYKAAQEAIRARYNFVAKTCWIAHVLAMSGKPMRKAPNRISDSERVHECPKGDKRAAIVTVLRELGMLGPDPVPLG